MFSLDIHFGFNKSTDLYISTVKPAHVTTSIKQLPVLKGHLFLSCHRKFHMN